MINSRMLCKKKIEIHTRFPCIPGIPRPGGVSLDTVHGRRGRCYATHPTIRQFCDEQAHFGPKPLSSRPRVEDADAGAAVQEPAQIIDVPFPPDEELRGWPAALGRTRLSR
ncbi:hypothetical protein NHG22_18940 [Streptomyces sp. ATE26]|uniref:hypothetical protein n=1 Tax=unclassified Streptomyces TaxID=2593676 RepID=UPI00116CB9D6|nr:MULTISPECIES: hypothetical protein [unclassified Streptomyces]MDI1455875.1 hypothetical protein [Streptomyces sp. ATE26]GEK03877.1 hypothetical protein TNCT1_61530 [Streptomyces sp. 1-11]